MTTNPMDALTAAKAKIDAHDDREAERRGRADAKRSALVLALASAERAAVLAERHNEQRAWAAHNQAIADRIGAALAEREAKIASTDTDLARLASQIEALEAAVTDAGRESVRLFADGDAVAAVQQEAHSVAARAARDRLSIERAQADAQRRALVAGAGDDSVADLTRERDNALITVRRANAEIARLAQDDEVAAPMPRPVPDLLHPLDRQRVERDLARDHRPVILMTGRMP